MKPDRFSHYVCYHGFTSPHVIRLTASLVKPVRSVPTKGGHHAHDRPYLQAQSVCKLWLAGKIIFCGFQEIPSLFKNLDYFT